MENRPPITPEDAAKVLGIPYIPAPNNLDWRETQPNQNAIKTFVAMDDEGTIYVKDIVINMFGKQVIEEKITEAQLTYDTNLRTLLFQEQSSVKQNSKTEKLIDHPNIQKEYPQKPDWIKTYSKGKRNFSYVALLGEGIIVTKQISYFYSLDLEVTTVQVGNPEYKYPVEDTYEEIDSLKCTSSVRDALVSAGITTRTALTEIIKYGLLNQIFNIGHEEEQQILKNLQYAQSKH